MDTPKTHSDVIEDGIKSGRPVSDIVRSLRALDVNDEHEKRDVCGCPMFERMAGEWTTLHEIGVCRLPVRFDV